MLLANLRGKDYL